MFAKKPMKVRSKMTQPRERKAINLLVDPEIKYLDVPGITNATDAGTLIPLIEVPQGASLTQRQGSFIHPKRCEIRGTITQQGTDIVRMMVVRLLYDASTASVGDILTGTPSLTGAFSPGNIDFLGQSTSDRKIEVLFDETYGVASAWHDTLPFHIQLNLRDDIHNAVRFRSSGANDIPVEGALALLLISQQNAGPSVSYWSRITYTDA